MWQQRGDAAATTSRRASTSQEMQWTHCYKMVDWVENYSFIRRFMSPMMLFRFCKNPHPMSVQFMEHQHHLILWEGLSTNPSAIHLLEANPDKIWWKGLSKNPAAMHLLEKKLAPSLSPAASSSSSWCWQWRWWKLGQEQRMPAKSYFEVDGICIPGLCANPSAIHLLEANLDKINWALLSENPAAIHLLEANPEKIVWNHLSKNPAAIHMLEANPNKICWACLSENPAAMHLLEQRPEKINWSHLARNPAALNLLEQNQDKTDWHFYNFIWENPAIFEPDFQHMKELQCAFYKEELMQKVFHPRRIARLIDMFGVDPEMLENCI